MLQYLILGNGYIGNYLARHLPNAKLLMTKVGSADLLKQLLLKEYPSHILINCAGKTGRPNIDWCEDHKDETFGCNVGLPMQIAEVCQEIKNYWIHLGSGCIYDGYDKEYTEEDPPNYNGSFYSKTKIWSQDILSEYDEPCILRIRMPIDDQLQERNYISKIIKYSREGKGLLDSPNSMTMLKDLCRAIEFLAERGHTGQWNIVNSGGVMASEILDLYKEFVDPSFKYKIEPIEKVKERLKAGRSNCILSNEKIENEGLKMPSLYDSIRAMLINYGQSNKQ